MDLDKVIVVCPGTGRGTSVPNECAICSKLFQILFIEDNLPTVECLAAEMNRPPRRLPTEEL
jgi:hypothetical protein